jgi:hypothetical protein
VLQSRQLHLPIIFSADPEHHNNYKNGEQIACRRCKLQKDTGSAICAFPQNLPEGADLDYDEIKAAMKAIVDHGCKCKCTSVGGFCELERD